MDKAKSISQTMSFMAKKRRERRKSQKDKENDVMGVIFNNDLKIKKRTRR